MNFKETNLNAFNKLKKLTEWNIPHRNTRNGIIICDTIMIAKNSSKWKILGSLDWYPYYGLAKLVEALYDDCLQEYAEEQQSKTNRKYNSVPISHEWKDKEKEKIMRFIYEQ